MFSCHGRFILVVKRHSKAEASSGDNIFRSSGSNNPGYCCSGVNSIFVFFSLFFIKLLQNLNTLTAISPVTATIRDSGLRELRDNERESGNRLGIFSDIQGKSFVPFGRGCPPSHEFRDEPRRTEATGFLGPWNLIEPQKCFVDIREARRPEGLSIEVLSPRSDQRQTC